MTPGELETLARQKYNAVEDTGFFPQQEVFDLIYTAIMELSNESYPIQNTATDTSVAGTGSYSYPTRAIAFKRITYDGEKLIPISLREDDALTLWNSNTTETGRPNFYTIWDDNVEFRPIPDTSGKTIEFFTFVEPARITTASQVLEIPTRYHLGLIYYVLAEMNAQDLNIQQAQYYRQLWNEFVSRTKRQERKRTRGDGFQSVQNVDLLRSNIVGVV